MPKATPKTIVKVKVTKPKPKAKKPKSKTKQSRWLKVCRELESFVKCNSDRYKIVHKDKLSYLILKSVMTTEIHKNDNYVHQPYSEQITGRQFKCFMVVDGFSQRGDDLTKEYFEEFGVPVFPLIMTEEVKYKLTDFR